MHADAALAHLINRFRLGACQQKQIQKITQHSHIHVTAAVSLVHFVSCILCQQVRRKTRQSALLNVCVDWNTAATEASKDTPTPDQPRIFRKIKTK